MLRNAIVLALLTLTACGLHRSYHPPPLTAVDPAAIRRIGDVELGLAMRFVGAHDGAPLLTVWLRNEGTRSVAFDLARVRIRGYDDQGSRALQLQDPRGEVEPLHIDPGASGREKLRLTDLARKDGDLRKICVDVTPVFTESNVQVPPVCFAPSAEAAWVVSS